jgi:chromosomal replication initiator protein
VESPLWKKCLDHLESELTAQQFNTWIRPLQAIEDDSTLRLLAPNRFVLDWVNERFKDQISEITSRFRDGTGMEVCLEVGSSQREPVPEAAELVNGNGRHAPIQVQAQSANADFQFGQTSEFTRQSDREDVRHVRGLQPEFTFENFVEGKSNQLARAASAQVGDNPASSYNPLFIYGGVGLGKTHLMHAIGNLMIQRNPSARVVYVHSERFVGDMIKALRHNAINEFKRYYRSVDALLIDDIQFFANKERSQEEFFHTFNSLIEGHSQIVMTCDR